MIGKSSSKPKAILGLEFEAGRLNVVLAARNGGAKLKQSFSAPMSVDVLTGDPLLAGQEIRNHLQEAGIHETRCVVCLPLPWFMQKQIELPDLPDEDRASYVKLQAEREFPFPAHELSVATSPPIRADGAPYSMLAAVPLTTVHAIEAVLKAAKLTLASITLGRPAGQAAMNAGCSLALHKRDQGIDCVLLRQGALITSRWFDCGDESEGAYSQEDCETFLRDIRLTLHALPASLQEELDTILLSGSRSWAKLIDPVLRNAFPSMAIQSGTPETGSSAGLSALCGPLFGAVSAYLETQKSALEFLPPRVSKLQLVVSRMSSRFSLLMGGTAAAVALVVISALLYQHFTLSHYQSEWSAIRDKVEELEAAQAKVKYFTPWFSRSLASLDALHSLTEAFPEQGSVWATNIEIKNISEISCSAFARDNRDLLEMMGKLNQNENISLLDLQQRQGQDPQQFTFQFRWVEG